MYTATYSPEDNKLRLYAAQRLDAETYEQAKALGFKWAPIQGLFVAPAWSPKREDFLVSLAGEIEAEGTTMAERAEAKAARLEGLAQKNAARVDAYSQAASRIASRFEFGQPILVGHHSERRARKDRERMDAAMRHAKKCADAVRYWTWKAAGAEAHANRKNSDRTRSNRIDTLLAELRDLQRKINHGYKIISIWEAIAKIENAETQAQAALQWAGSFDPHEGGYSPRDTYDNLKAGKITTAEAIAASIELGEAITESSYTSRCIGHTLNRLAYERSFLGDVPRFEGELTPVILQTFARAHGAHKPEGVDNGDGTFTLRSKYPLPAHLADGAELTQSADAWRDLMQSVGYAVEIKEKRVSDKPKAPPLLNPTREDAEKLQALWNATATAARSYSPPSAVMEMTQDHYSAHSKGEYGRYKTIEIDASGSRVWQSWSKKERITGVCRVRVASGGLHSADRVIIITDAKQHALPDFSAQVAA